MYTVYEGFQGLVDGGERIREATSASVGGILHRGDTVLGTARCDEFRTREGRHKAARNLDALGIDKAIIGGHSFGGLISYYLAANLPERVAKCIAMDAPAEVHVGSWIRSSRRLIVLEWCSHRGGVPIAG